MVSSRSIVAAVSVLGGLAWGVRHYAHDVDIGNGSAPLEREIHAPRLLSLPTAEVDTSRLISNTKYQFEEHDGNLVGGATTYASRVEGQTLRITPDFGDSVTRPILSLTTKSVSRGNLDSIQPLPS